MTARLPPPPCLYPQPLLVLVAKKMTKTLLRFARLLSQPIAQTPAPTFPPSSFSSFISHPTILIFKQVPSLQWPEIMCFLALQRLAMTPDTEGSFLGLIALPFVQMETFVKWPLYKTFVNVYFLEGSSFPARAHISCLEEPLGNPGPLEKANPSASLAIDNPDRYSLC